MSARTTVAISRRDALKTGTATAFLLAIESSAVGAEQPRVLAGWLKIAPNNAITILTNTSEIGQGTSTSLAQLLADELDADWKDVHLEMAPLDSAHINPGFGEYATYGSGGVQYQIDAYRTAGARARMMLIQVAADTWHVPTSELGTDKGFVVHTKTTQRASYGELASRAAHLPLPAKSNLKPRNSFRYIGHAMPRLDIPSKTNGTAVFGIDVRVPGMKIATIMQSPRFGGKLKSVDPKPALAVPGVEHVVPMTSAVAVVATGYWQAQKGLQSL